VYDQYLADQSSCYSVESDESREVDRVAAQRARNGARSVKDLKNRENAAAVRREFKEDALAAAVERKREEKASSSRSRRSQAI